VSKDRNRGCKLAALRAQLEMIRQVHWEIRAGSLSDPNHPGAHIANENLVVRIASAFEAHGIGPDELGYQISEGDPYKVYVQAAFFLRNVILHEAAGHLCPKKIDKYDDRKAVYEKFCELVPGSEGI